MSSRWLAGGSSASKRSKIVKDQSSRAPHSYDAVFTDDPGIIGRKLPRPPSPFVPAPDFSFFPRGAEPDHDFKVRENACESPARGSPYDFDRPAIMLDADPAFTLF
jgi:hypothetical protein